MIELRQITVRSGSFTLENVCLTVSTGRYAVLMGPSGAGKTTLLEAICGLRPVSQGTIQLDGIDVTASSPAARQIGYVPQDRALFPTMTVREHLEFALRLRKWPDAKRSQRVQELAELLGITALLPRGIHGLSGGEAQRVALGRALSFRPRILLLDEPLSAVDEATREDIQRLLREIQRSTGVTLLHVTHSADEARNLADDLYLLEGGTLRSVETLSS